VSVDFAMQDNRNAAVVVLSRPDGALIEAGAHGQLEGGANFLVGYDGRAYIAGLRPMNAIVVEIAGGRCRASFAFRAEEDKQAVIPATCEPVAL
jgi:outer membrane usher protein